MQPSISPLSPEPFIRNSWYVASWAHELSADSPLAVTIVGEPLVLFRDDMGSAVALRDCCCHRNAPLSLGRCEAGQIRCLYHGLLFDGSGRCVAIPGQQHVPSTYRVRAFPVAEAGGWLWVWMGDPRRADPQCIPQAAVCDTSAWDMRTGALDLHASYLLVSDNLCDHSHVAFLHAATFGGGDSRIADTYPKISPLERGMRVERWLTGRAKIEQWLPDEAGEIANNKGLDLWLTYDYLVPGILIMHSEIHWGGTAQRSDFLAPQAEPLHADLARQAVTPVTEKTSRYFFALGPRRSESLATPGLPDQMFEALQRGFHEDQRMLEAQQRNLERWSIDCSGAIQHDRGVYLMRAMIDRLLAQERTATGQSDLHVAS
jgi:nitrite reductase/ring-hydroxylating ferredoxin subunit